VPYALVVGADRIGEILGDLRASQPGRALPLVPPVSADVALLLITTTLGVVGLLMAATLAIRRAPGDPTGRVLLAFALFAAGCTRTSSGGPTRSTSWRLPSLCLPALPW